MLDDNPTPDVSAVRSRIEELARKNTEGELTEVERKEYEAYIRLNNRIAVLEANFRKL